MEGNAMSNNDKVNVYVTVAFEFGALSTLPQFAGMGPDQIAAAIQHNFREDISDLVDHMVDYGLDINVKAMQ